MRFKMFSTSFFSAALLLLNLAPAQCAAVDWRHWRKGDPHPIFGDWPKLESISINVEISISTGGHFDYAYEVVNSTTNRFPLYLFRVDLRDHPESHPLSRSDITITHYPQTHEDALNQGPRVQPLSQEAAPGWVSHYEPLDGTWAVGQLGDKNAMIAPGQRKSGFKLVTKEPPGIRQFSVDGYSFEFMEPDLIPDASEMSGEDYKQFALSAFNIESDKGIQYVGVTIAPVTPMESFAASTWAAHIRELAGKARQYNWIKTDAALIRLSPLIAALNTAKTTRLKKAVSTLSDVTGDLMKSGEMTAEADALIRLNAEYLLRRTIEGKRLRQR